MKKNLLLLFFSVLFFTSVQGQMTFNGQLRYGNEWIDHEQSYLKIKTVQDGWYRITVDQLRSAGVPIGEVPLSALRLEYFGEPVPLARNSSEGYIAFYGLRNRGELDRQLFDDPDEEMLNPYYSMYSDTAVYYLSWENPAAASLNYAEIPNDLTSLPEKETWYRYTERKVFGDRAYSITYDGQRLLTLSKYDTAEGFGSLPGPLHNITFNPTPADVAGEEARLFIQFFSNRFNNQLNLLFNGKEYLRENVNQEDNLLRKEVTIPLNELQATSVLTIKDLNDRSEQYGIAFAELTYPRSLDAGSQAYFSFELPAGNRRYFEIDNFDTSGGEVWVYNLRDQTKLRADLAGTTVRFALSATTSDAQILIVNESAAYLPVADLKPNDLRDFRESQADYLIITHRDLMKKNNGVDQVAEYATYRRSTQGGGYQVEVITVDELFDQYAYGVHGHPLAIQNFSQWAVQHWPRLKYVLLLGHGYNYLVARNDPQTLAPGNYIPTYGNPGSDNLLLAPKGSVVSSFAFGRIAAHNPQEIKQYLDKLKEYDAAMINATQLEERLWRKRVLHISGGSNPEDQLDFERRMMRLGERLYENGFGADLSLVSKKSNEAVQQSTSSRVKEAVDAGVSIKAFLGHGGVTSTDFGLDDPSYFDNKGRYPLIFSLGCKTGDMYDQQFSLSESFSLAPERGGIGYIASAGFAYPSTLEILTREFYRLLGDELYTAGVGDILRSMRQNLQVPWNVNVATYSLLEQMSFEGDPAVRLNLYKAPDYVVDPASVNILPRLMTAAQDSFTVRFDILNLGFNRVDTFALELRHILPNGTVEVYKDTVEVNIGKNHFSYRFRLGEEEVEGEHRIEVAVDADNVVPELPAGTAESNNELTDDSGRKGISFFVQQNAILPISPPPFAIVNEEKPSLVASSNTLEKTERNYIFELDTTAYFNSSLKKIFELKSKGGVLSWTPDVNWMDGQVYYWRVREKDLGEIRWVERSFIFYPDSLAGWNQSEYFQIATDSLTNLERIEAQRLISFTKGFILAEGTAMSHTLEFNNDASKFEYDDGIPPERKYWGANYWRTDGAWDSHMFVAVFDPKTGRYWRNSSRGEFGSIPIRINYHGYAFLVTQQQGRESMVRFIQEQVPEGHYVLVITSQRFDSSLKVEDWAADSLAYGTNIFRLLEEQGALQIRQLESRGSLPYVFAFIKGVRPLEEALAFDITDQVTINFDVPFLRTQGTITSPLIGPARSWTSLAWQPRLPEGQSDEIDLTLLKWNADRSLADTMIYDKGGYFDLSDIDAAQYPYLQLKYRVRDPADRSFSQLDFWRVMYERLPDLVLSTGNNFSFHADTLQRGDELKLDASLMAFNSGVQDSIGLRYSIRSRDNQSTTITQLLAPQEEGSTQAVQFRYNTEDLRGDYELVVEANPLRNIQEDQYANNLGVLPFVVGTDRENPILDVTFDGRHILDGELVSARPLINISLTDENEFLEIQDTSSFELWLEFPDGAIKEFHFDDPRIRFYPAEEGKKNRARVEFEPVLEQDGEYKLRIRASDASGNVAGSSNYEVNFQVITESQLSNVLPYPNPFTTSCRFVYTLTGDREPVDFKIQILTVSGRIVREVTKFEFGQLKVGTHTSDFVWDGTDEYGDRLANGVYLYRVIAKDAEGEDLKHFERSEVDGYFKNDFGKIVILR